MTDESKKKGATFDWRDFIGLAGLGMLSAGLYMVWMPAALIAPGAVLTYVAIFGTKG